MPPVSTIPAEVLPLRGVDSRGYTYWYNPSTGNRMSAPPRKSRGKGPKKEEGNKPERQVSESERANREAAASLRRRGIVDPDENRNGGAVGRRFGGPIGGGESALELAQRYASGRPRDIELPGADLARTPSYNPEQVEAHQRWLREPGSSVQSESGMIYDAPVNDPDHVMPEPTNPILRWWNSRRAGRNNGGVVTGPVVGITGGREDAKPVDVEGGSYVLPSDCVSALGDGNTLAGHRALDKVFGTAAASRAVGGAVPIMISDGEHVLTADQVTKFGGGDHARGCRVLDQFVKDTRAKNVKRLQKLPPPAKS